MNTLIFLKRLKYLNFLDKKIKTGKNIILDLDLTLLKTFDNTEVTELSKCAELMQCDYAHIIYKIPERLANGSVGTFAMGVKRPELWQFLYFCFLYFDNVCVWTAGTKDYARRIVKTIFKDLPEPYIMYTRDDCATDDEGFYYKPLEIILNDDRLKGKMTKKNTFILDDSPHTYQKNPENAIEIPKYDISPTLEDIKKVDNVFLLLMYYFSKPEVLFAEDVREIEKPDLFI